MRTWRPLPSSISDMRRRRSLSPGMLGRDLVEQRAVDQVDDLQVPRQQPLEERDRPDLERLGQQRVVGVREHAARDGPRALPVDLVLVDQQPHQLGDRERRVRVVQLDRDRVGQRIEAAAFGEVLREHVLQARADEEVLLLEAQFLALRRGVVRVEDARDVLGVDLLVRRLVVPARVEQLDVERRDRAPGPEPQVVDRRAAVARDQLVEADRPDVVRVDPAVARLALRVLRCRRSGRRSGRRSARRRARSPTGCARASRCSRSRAAGRPRR